MKNFLTDNTLVDRYRSIVRDKAITRAKSKIALAGLKPQEMDPMDLEIVVKEQEDEIISAIKKMPLYAIIALLGIGVW